MKGITITFTQLFLTILSPARSLTQILHIRKYDATTGGKGVIVEDCESWDQANKRVNQLRKDHPEAVFYVRRRISNAEKNRRANARRDKKGERLQPEEHKG